jgi:hypothetical protein
MSDFKYNINIFLKGFKRKNTQKRTEHFSQKKENRIRRLEKNKKVTKTAIIKHIIEWKNIKSVHRGT